MRPKSRFNYQQKQKKRKLIITYFIISFIISFIGLSAIFVKNLHSRHHLIHNFNQPVIGGIPLILYLDVIIDPKAVFSMITGNKIAFRNRLKELNIEDKMRALYRPYFNDEIELERYIDQIFYDSSGYANGSEYLVTEDGDLIKKIKPQPQKPQGNSDAQGLFTIIKP